MRNWNIYVIFILYILYIWNCYYNIFYVGKYKFLS